MDNFECVCSNKFNYVDVSEVQCIVERTITKVLQHAHLTPFVYPNYLVVSNDLENNLLVTELELRPGEAYSQNRENRDLQRLASHYRALKNEVVKKYKSFLNNLNRACANQNANGSFRNVWSDVESLEVHLLDFEKEHQYFLSSHLRFVSLNRAPYDRDGRVCQLRFAIEPC